MAYTDVPYQDFASGIRTQQGTLLPPGGRPFYVHHSGGRAYDPTEVRGHTYTTLNAALGQCASGNGDTVFVLEGHAENISAADQMSNLVAGVNIIGCGSGNNRPTFTWTASGSTFLFDVANVLLANCILLLEPGTGTVSVTAPITVSAAGCAIVGCRMRTSTDSSNLATIPLALTDGADQFTFLNNQMFGATAGECTTQMDIAGADQLVMKNNYFHGATASVAVGIVRFKTTAATGIWLENNTYVNKKASSTAAVTGVASVTGVSINETFCYLDTSSTTMWLTSPGLMHFRQAFVSNTAGENGIIATVVST